MKCVTLSIDCRDFYVEIDSFDFINQGTARILEYLERIDLIFTILV